MEGITLKGILALAGSFLSSVILTFFNVGSAVFASALVGSIIGAAMRKESESTTTTILTIVISTVLALWLGPILLVHFNEYPVNGVFGLLGCGINFYGETIKEAIRNWISKKGKGDHYDGGYMRPPRDFDDFGDRHD